MGVNELYNSIVDDVLENVKEAFLDEGFDEQILKSLRDAWLCRIRDAQQPRRTQPQTLNQNQNQNQNNQHQQAQNHELTHQQPQQQQQHHQQQSHLQQHQQQSQPASVIVSMNSDNHPSIPQLDGSSDTSDSSDEEDIPDDDDDVEISDEEDRESESTHDDEDPLNSGDDVSNDESSEMFETDNVVVCQYDKITRNRNKWRFHLKDGVMNVNGKDYVFQKAVGDAEW